MNRLIWNGDWEEALQRVTTQGAPFHINMYAGNENLYVNRYPAIGEKPISWCLKPGEGVGWAVEGPALAIDYGMYRIHSENDDF